ncbi:MAG: hypothetical protein L0229_29745 [Blastocatellia bacterium]|nr:hypothetical protein [Blastocatellia bacterium]
MNSEKKYSSIPDLGSLYYHRDFDGAVSAAMLASLLSTTPQLYPVDYQLKARWASMDLEKPAAVVDFLFHPDATLWIDHHVNPFVLPEWKEIAFRRRFHLWDTDAPSCPPLINRVFHFPENLSEHFAPYIHWSSIIDSARYESPQAATDLNNPFLLLSKILALPDTEAVINRVVREITHRPIDAVLAHPEIQPLAEKVMNIEYRMKKEVSKLIRYDGLVVFLDQSFKSWPYQRYYPYLIHPDASYVVGIYRSDHSFTVSVGANPWRPEPEIHLGLLCNQLGGGGRKNVAGVPATNVEMAHIIANRIIEKLHEVTTKSNMSGKKVSGSVSPGLVDGL